MADLTGETYAFIVDVTNTDTAKGPVFTLEDGKAITDVIDTTAKKTAYMEFTDGAKAFYGLILEIKAGSAPVEDENAPVVAGATLERITGSVYGSATNVYLAKLPADAAQFSVTLQSDEFVVAGNLFHAENYTSYASQAYLDSTDWYNSLDAVMEDLRAYDGYKSVEEMLKINGYSSKEECLKANGCNRPAEYWQNSYGITVYEAEPFTLQNSDLAAMKASTFNRLFSSSSVKFDPTVAFRLLEVHTDSSILKNDDRPGYGEGNPRSVLLLQFGERPRWTEPPCSRPSTPRPRRRTGSIIPPATAITARRRTPSSTIRMSAGTAASGRSTRRRWPVRRKL